MIETMFCKAAKEYNKNEVKKKGIEYYYNRDNYTVSIYNEKIIKDIYDAVKNNSNEKDILKDLTNSFSNLDDGFYNIMLIDNGFMNRISDYWSSNHKRTYTTCISITLVKAFDCISLRTVVTKPDTHVDFFKDISYYPFSSEEINKKLCSKTDVIIAELGDLMTYNISNYSLNNIIRYNLVLNDLGAIIILKSLLEDHNHKDGNTLLEDLIMTGIYEDLRTDDSFTITCRADNLEVLRKHIIISLLMELEDVINVNVKYIDCDFEDGFRITNDEVENKMLTTALKRSIYRDMKDNVYCNYLEEFEILKDFNKICEILTDKEYNLGDRVLNLYKALGGKRYY